MGSCGNGSQRRSRSQTEPRFGGKACPHYTETRPCNTHRCANHCIVTAFSAWTTCTKSCGSGVQSRSRSVTSAPRFGGYACPYLNEKRACNKHACASHCVVSQFSAWTTCTKSCGTGSQSRSRSVTSAPRFGGYACPYLNEKRACNKHACASHCVVSQFSAWTTCTKS